jgi:hypothetical protein
MYRDEDELHGHGAPAVPTEFLASDVRVRPQSLRSVSPETSRSSMERTRNTGGQPDYLFQSVS